MNVVDTTFSAKNNNKELFYVAEPEMSAVSGHKNKMGAMASGMSCDGCRSVVFECWKETKV